MADHHNYSNSWEAMDNQGYAVLHTEKKPPRELLLTMIENCPDDFTRVQCRDSPFYYIAPRWGTVLFQKLQEYVQHEINVRRAGLINLSSLADHR
jgi:hypothetical protein